VPQRLAFLRGEEVEDRRAAYASLGGTADAATAEILISRLEEMASGKVEITSQNHGFVVKQDSLPANVEETYRSLFDGTNEGIKLKDKLVFSVQHHPEASPGPQDCIYLFDRFIDMIASRSDDA